jgi:hypothetical protein
MYTLELLGIFATVFGVFFINTVILNMTAGRTYEGYQMVYLNLLIFGAWYIVAGLLISISHPNPSKYRFLVLGFIVAILLVLSSQGWTDSKIDFTSRLKLWLVGYANYIIAMPGFFMVGIVTEKYVHRNSNCT